MKKAGQIAAVVFCLCIAAAAAVPVNAAGAVQADCYWYDKWGDPVTIPDVCDLTQTVELAALTDRELKGITDAFVCADGTIYILDQSGVVLCLDADRRLTGVLEPHTADGTADPFSDPEGIFFDEKNGRLYVADTGNQRVVRLRKDGTVENSFYRPETLTGTLTQLDYQPVKLAVDNAGRLYVVARNINMGIIVLDKNGRFIAYRGAPEVTLSLYDQFWRQFSTKEQLERMETYIPTEYNNLTIDGDSFLWGTISAIDDEDLIRTIQTNNLGSNVAPIKKLNLAGKDILRRKGLYPPVGDLDEKSLSSFGDVALADCGIYTVLDTAKGHLFTYDDDGELLYVFGRIGDRHQDFKKPVAVAYSGDSLLVFDGGLNAVFCFDPSDYGAQVLRAVRSYYNGDYADSYAAWGEVLDYNANLKLAYVGVGKSYLQQGDYQQAITCFRKAGDKANCSEAYRKIRDENVRRFFPWIAGGTGVLIVLFFIAERIRRLRRYLSGQ